MRKQDRLIALIHSFTRGERKYFVQNNSTANGAKSYVKLYEALLQSNIYDSNELCRRLSKSKADLANEKKYLENALVTSLLNYHAQDNEAGAFINAATGILLPQKGMNEMFLARVSDLKSQAAQKQHYGLLAELCYMEFNAWYALDGEMNTVKTAMNNALAEARNALHNAGLMLQFEELSVRVTFMLQNQQYFANQKEANALLANPLLCTRYNEPYFEHTRHHILASLNYVLLNYKAAAQHTQQCISIIEKNAGQVNINELGYYKLIVNLVQFLTQSGALEKAEQLLQKTAEREYKKLPFDTEKLDALFEARYYDLRLYLIMVQYRHNKITGQQIQKLLAEFSAKLPKRAGQMRHSNLINALILAAKLYLLIGKPAAAIDFLNKIIHETDETVRPAMQASARLCFLIAHQELGNRSLMPGLVASTKRFYEKYKLYSVVEKDLFSFLLKWANKPGDAKALQPAFLALQKKFIKINASKQLSPRIAQADLLDWIERNMGK